MAAPGGRSPAERLARDIVDHVRTEAAPRSGDVRLSAAAESEIAAIRRMVGQLVCASRAPVDGLPPALEEWYLRLLENEIASDVASRIISTVRTDLTAAEQCDAAAVRKAVLISVARLIPVARDLGTPARGRDGRPHTIALVGPTGVGKTTTLAKLAATWKLRHGLSVGVITADTYRIAAVDQLRVYAGIMNLPLEIVSSPAEMARACRSMDDKDVILIDTAGRSPRDAKRLAELQTLIEAAGPDEVHMVLAATASGSAMASTLDQFRALGPTHTILTKLDEAASLGVVLGTLTRLQAHLSFLTTGQEVPDQIERACPDRFARWVVDGGVSP
jgi:flagellar biosynthesis protein FlhF